MHELDKKVDFNLKMDELDAARQVADPLADEVIKYIMEEGLKESLYAVFRAKSFEDITRGGLKKSLLTRFIHEKNTLPDWSDMEKMQISSQLFRSNGNEFLFMLGIVSLPYCYAASKGALSLYHTEKIRKNTEARLLDTTSFIVEIMQKEAFCENGKGFLAIKQVRLRHALARYFLNKNPAIIDLGEQPINQEDMAGTNLAFSYVVLREMPKIGVKISPKMQDAYIHFWSVIGYLLGVQKELLPNDIREAFWLEKRISHRQFFPSKEGKELSEQLVNHYKRNIPNKATITLINPLIRHLLGKQVSEIIGLRKNDALYPIDFLMTLLPIFKRFIFPPVQSFETIVDQIEQKRKTAG